jgi:hypothetical protein
VKNYPHELPAVTLSSIPALYVVLFLFSIQTLHQRVPGGKILLGTAWAMCLLATCSTLIAIIATSISMRMVYLLVQGSVDTSTHLLSLYHMLALAQDIILAVNK